MRNWKKCPTRRQFNRRVKIRTTIYRATSQLLYKKDFSELNANQKEDVIRRLKEVM